MSARTARGWWKNIRAGKQLALDLMAEGFVVMCPHLGAHLEEANGYDEWDWERWLAYDEDVIRVVDVVLMMDGWEESKGATREHTFAKRIGTPIAYSLDELRAIARSIRKERRETAA